MPVTEHDGLRWLVDDGPADAGDILGPHHEQAVEQEVLSRVPPDGVLLDVGAHVGHYALRAARWANWVIAVEPNPATFARLQENLELNGIGNVSAWNLAAWDDLAWLSLDSPHGHARDGSTRVAPADGGEIPGVPLDILLAGEPQIDLVKVDVEGADLHVLRGMRRTLERLRPEVFIEDHSIYGYYERASLDALLDDMGYSVRPAGMYGCAPYLIAQPR
jgi:FkbM family methyltransferase